MGDLELVALWELLPNAESTGTLMDDVLSSPEGEQLVFSTPDNFINVIADLADSEIPTIAEICSQIDELSAWDINSLEKVIRDIRKIASDAIASNQIVVQLAEM